MFAEEAFQAKKQAALEAMQKQAKDRDAVSVKAKESEMSFADWSRSSALWASPRPALPLCLLQMDPPTATTRAQRADLM